MIYLLRGLWSRCRALLTRDRLDREFDEELTTHLALLVDEYRQGGLSAADARREALCKLGRPELLREVHREQRGLPLLDALVQDLRYGLRMLRKSPAFTLVAVLSLALGIGANTALFSVIDNLLIRSLPVRDPDRLVQIQRVWTGLGIRKSAGVFPNAVIETVRADSRVIDAIVGFNRLDRPEIVIDGGIEPTAQAEEVSDNFFQDLGIAPMLGRDPEASERGVALVSEWLWRARFGGSPSVLGRALTVDRETYSIIGVAPRQFRGMSIDASTDLWISPRMMSGGFMIGRLKPAVTPAQARASLQVLFDDLALDPPGATMQVEVLPAGKGLSQLRGQYQRPLLALVVLVALLLLVTCANLGNLLILRNMARRRELSVRAALGASRARLMKQYLVESAMLAVLGAMVGVVFAKWGVSLILSMLPLSEIPRSLAFQVDARTLGFAAVITVLTATLFAVAPARHAARIDLSTDLKSAHGNAATKNSRLGRTLVACQVALSVLLLAGAGLFVETLRNLARLDIGFDPDNLLQVSIDTRGAGYGEGQVGVVHSLLLERISAIPGVASVASIRNPVMRNSLSRTSFSSSGEPTIGPDEAWDSADVSPGFFETMKIPVVRGRTFAAAVNTPGRPRLVVNEAFARQYFPNADPVGRIGGAVVGVVRDAKLASVRREGGPMMYFMMSPDPDRVSALEARINAVPEAIIPSIREEVRRVNPRLLVDIRTMRGEIDRTISTERMVATLSAFFSVLGLLLASIGIFGTAAYTVTQRTNELGIRRALGAGSWSIIRDSVRDTMVVFAVGLTAGIIAATTAIRLTASSFSELLYGVTAMDVTNMVLAGLLMIAVALAACVLPAHRAIRIDPLKAIRYE